MRLICRLGRSIWHRTPFQWAVAVFLGALVGIFAGHRVIASVSGSVSVVDGSSMQPTFAPGTRVYTAPISSPLLRGDIILVDDGNKDYALKRIVGMPGDSIQLWRGYVFINRKMLREPYLSKHTYTFPDPGTEKSGFKLGPGQYFVMGDNREFSVDSRRYGPVNREQIKSRVPSGGNVIRAWFSGYTLPQAGKRAIRAL